MLQRAHYIILLIAILFEFFIPTRTSADIVVTEKKAPYSCQCILTDGHIVQIDDPSGIGCSIRGASEKIDGTNIYSSCKQVPKESNTFSDCKCGSKYAIPTPNQADCGAISDSLLKSKLITEQCVWKIPEGFNLDDSGGIYKKIEWKPLAPNLAINIPTIKPFTTEGLDTPDSEGNIYIPFIGQYAAGVYKYLLLIAGVIAAVRILAAGFNYAAAGGNTQEIEAAKSSIAHALIGLFIVLGSYIILYFINPDLVKFSGLKIHVIQTEGIPSDDYAPSEGQTLYSKGTQCFLETFGSTKESVKWQLKQINLLGKKIKVHSLAVKAFQEANSNIKSSQYEIKSIGSFNWRQNVNSPDKLSSHSFGVAIDINPKQNPNIKNYKLDNPGKECPHDLPDDIIQAFKSAGFRWGGDYKKTCDAMHFEWFGPCEKSGG